MSSVKSFPAVEGIRAIFNFWIVALHVHMIQKFFLGIYGKISQLEHLSDSTWSGIAVGNGYQVDVFFALSGFLFTWSIIQTGKVKSLYGQLVTLGLFVVKRVLRLWPVLVSVLIIAFVVKDYGSWNLYEMALQLTIPNYRDPDTPQAVVPGWSNRVDIECCLMLFVIINIMNYLRILNTFTALLLIPLSLVPKALRFLSDPDMFSYMRLAADVMTTAIMIPVVRHEYYRDVLFKASNHTFAAMEGAPRMTPLFFKEYVVWHQRWSPFFVGAAVAVALLAAYQKSKKTEERTSFQYALHLLSRFGSFLLLLVSIVLAMLPILMSLSPPTAEVRATVLSNPPVEADFFVSVLGRTLNACGWGYLLYRCLLPVGHPLRLNLLSSFLSNPLFQFIGKHSYCIYMLHFVVVHYVCFLLLTPSDRHPLVGEDENEKLFQQFTVLLAISYIVTFAISAVIVHFIEQPALKVLQVQMKIIENNLIGGKVAKSSKRD